MKEEFKNRNLINVIYYLSSWRLNRGKAIPSLIWKDSLAFRYQPCSFFLKCTRGWHRHESLSQHYWVVFLWATSNLKYLATFYVQLANNWICKTKYGPHFTDQRKMKDCQRKPLWFPNLSWNCLTHEAPPMETVGPRKSVVVGSPGARAAIHSPHLSHAKIKIDGLYCLHKLGRSFLKISLPVRWLVPNSSAVMYNLRQSQVLKTSDGNASPRTQVRIMKMHNFCWLMFTRVTSANELGIDLNHWLGNESVSPGACHYFYTLHFCVMR